ncbi:Tyrosine phenol-lyase [bacterium HR21]|nr:Tyrosine phenol-lyase [bacterium HR21]
MGIFYGAEPYRLKTIEPLRLLPPEERRQALERAGYNVFRLSHEEVFLTFAHFRGLHAMSDSQWSGMLIGDEAYAGSRNFFHLEQSARSAFATSWLIPTHRGRGALNLLAHACFPKGTLLFHGPLSPLEEFHFRRFGARLVPVPVVWTDTGIAPQQEFLQEMLAEEVPQYFYWRLSPEGLGFPPSDLRTLRRIFAMLAERGVRILWNASGCFAHCAVQGLSPDILRELARHAFVVLWNAREDGFSHTGALLCGTDPELYQSLQALVVVYEGLHTYGGLAGRDMEAIARGMQEALTRPELFQHHWQLRTWLQRELHRRGFQVGELQSLWGIHLSAADFGRQDTLEHLAALAAALYLLSGISIGINADRLWIALPLRRYMPEHFLYLLTALERLREGAASVPLLRPDAPLTEFWHEDATFTPLGDFPEICVLPPASLPPYRIKHVELLLRRSREERHRALCQAGYNTFLLRSEDVFIDLLTDSGTSAQSDQQWAELLRAPEPLNRSAAWEIFAETVRQVLGFPYVLVTHQGRAAEHILSQTLIRPGQYVLNNMYFTTTREHQERAGGIFVDLIIPEAHDPENPHPFKGDMDTEAVEDFIHRHGADQIAYICLEMNVNMAGGQPVSLEGTRRLAAVARHYGIPLIFDATRCAENAYLIRQREPGQHERSIAEILRELMSYADGLTFSAKKDVLVNIGGFLALRDEQLYRRMVRLLRLFEGEPYTGGLAARDLLAMAQGLREMLALEYLRSRIEQVQQFGAALQAAGIPIVVPIGGHAVYVDAARVFPHIPQDCFPAQCLAAELYRESGVRSMERGTVSAGRDPRTGRHRYPKLELVRLTLPRRVYTSAHLEAVVEGLQAVLRRRDTVRGLRMVYEPPVLRFFTARFEPL